MHWQVSWPRGRQAQINHPWHLVGGFAKIPKVRGVFSTYYRAAKSHALSVRVTQFNLFSRHTPHMPFLTHFYSHPTDLSRKLWVFSHSVKVARRILSAVNAAAPLSLSLYTHACTERERESPTTDGGSCDAFSLWSAGLAGPHGGETVTLAPRVNVGRYFTKMIMPPANACTNETTRNNFMGYYIHWPLV